ncbi:MAG: alpha/beta hydrolase [Burkholderiaceae bacterium]|nr:alpha/beta hydrolase [Burkholderiaceae bacterium]
MTKVDRIARFEDFDGHRSPVLHWRPRGRVRAQAVFFPPYGDEMNQSRRMYRLAAEALAMRGVAGRMFDLLGTGDSSADFREATVSAWLSDCRRMLDAAQAEDERIVLIGCRLGAALAAKASDGLARQAALFVGWAPLLQGSQQLNGLLRVAKIARMNRPQVPDPKALWAMGEVAWLAGYPVSATLADQLTALDATNAPRAERAVLFEVRSAQDDASLHVSEGLRRRAETWVGQGVPTQGVALRGPAFWNVADLVDVPQLVQATVAAVDETLGEAVAGIAQPEARQR